MKIGRHCGAVALAAALVCFLSAGRAARADEILVSAASSLTDALTEIGKAYTRTEGGTVVRFNIAASGALQQQIEQGAPVDVFASASPREMDALEQSGRIERRTRRNFAGNRLALIVPVGSRIRRWEDLASPRVRRLAISDPASVPSGRYARQTLEHRDLWQIAHLKAVLGENVRQTLAYVADGDVEAGIVFTTDALTDPKRVKIAATANPGKDHDPIVYPAAVVRDAPNPGAAARFVAFLSGRAARDILARYGFTTDHLPRPGRDASRP